LERSNGKSQNCCEDETERIEPFNNDDVHATEVLIQLSMPNSTIHPVPLQYNNCFASSLVELHGTILASSKCPVMVRIL